MASKSETKADSSSVDSEIDALLERVKQRDPHQAKFLQAVDEVVTSLRPLFAKEPKYIRVMEAICEAERAVQFRVPWMDDNGKMHINRGFRVQFSSALGPYKGGLRLHPSVDMSVVKFLGFEQIFKNALTTLPMGAGKGGSDFNPKGKSQREVMAFCQSFMTELARHIGPNQDVPAGDIGVGAREIGYLLGQYKRLQQEFSGGVLTGKAVGWGGSLMRTQATGYGLIYITSHALKARDDSFKDKKCLVSGSGNVAQWAARKITEMGGKVITLSDSSGFVEEPDGFTMEQLEHITYLKETKRARIKEYTEFSKTAKYTADERPWGVKADMAFPCATENEISLDDMKSLVSNGVSLIAEGANMPSSTEAIHYAREKGITFIPAKAANAGGVATSGLEMSQNSQRLAWTEEEVDEKLQDIMKQIHDNSLKEAERLGHAGDYQLGANAVGFRKVADAMIAQGMFFVEIQ